MIPRCAFLFLEHAILLLDSVPRLKESFVSFWREFKILEFPCFLPPSHSLSTNPLPPLLFHPLQVRPLRKLGRPSTSRTTSPPRRRSRSGRRTSGAWISKRRPIQQHHRCQRPRRLVPGGPVLLLCTNASFEYGCLIHLISSIDAERGLRARYFPSFFFFQIIIIIIISTTNLVSMERPEGFGIV